MKLLIQFSFFVTVLLVSMACSTTKKVDSATQTENTSKKSNKEDTILFASLERGFCFGTCKVYDVKIYKSGFATYVGKAKVDRIGNFTGTVAPALMKELSALAIKINYAGLNDVYDDPRMMDVPEIKSAMRIDGKLKQVMRRVGYPESIKVFENKIDSIIAATEWKSVDK